MLSPQERFRRINQASVSPVGHLLAVAVKGKVVQLAPLSRAFLCPDVREPEGDKCPGRCPPLCNVTAQGDTVTGWGQLKEMTTWREGFKIEQGEFPSCSVFRTQCFHCKGMGSIPGWGIKIHVPLGTVKGIK